MNADAIDDQPGRILVVDDGELNRQLLTGVLEAKGHRVEVADHGSVELIDRVAADPPDALLLDVMMPGIDGLGLCERFKRRPETAHVPVLLITSLSDRAVRLRGIAAGANDFLVKPIDTQDIALRVRNAIRLKRLFDRMREANERQHAAEHLRDNLVHMIVHDLRSPLFTVRLYLEAFLGDSAEVAPDLRSDIEKALAVSGGMVELIGSILDISRFEAGEMPLQAEPCALQALCEEALATVHGQAAGKRVSVAVPELELVCDRALMRRALANLLGNACKHARAAIELGAAVSTRGLELWVLDDGPGVPAASRARIFEKFGSTSADKGRSTGLGLPFCKLAVAAHGGAIGVDDAPGGGSRFWITLPLKPAGGAPR